MLEKLLWWPCVERVIYCFVSFEEREVVAERLWKGNVYELSTKSIQVVVKHEQKQWLWRRRYVDRPESHLEDTMRQRIDPGESPVSAGTIHIFAELPLTFLLNPADTSQ